MLCVCGCGKEIVFKRHHKYRNIKYIHGHNKSRLGSHHTEEAKEKMREARLGSIGFWEGKIRIDMLGENHFNWKGGKKIWVERQNAKRRELGYNCINEPFSDDEVAHHLTIDYVAYVPEYINKSVSHNIHTGKNMDEVNFYTLNYLFLVYNKE